MAKIKKNTFQATVQESHLEKAVNATPDVNGHFHKGLGALKANDKDKISVPDTSKYALILSKHGIKPVKVWEYDKI